MNLELIGAGLLAAMGAALAFLWRMWRRADDQARDERRRANTSERMRDHEHEASQMDDVSLADRISRNP